MDRRALLLGLLWDAGLPAAAYYAGRAVGLDAFLALTAGGIVALLRVGYVAVRRRRVDGVAAFIAVVFAVLLLASLVGGDAHLLLARESVVSGVLGLLLLGSCLVRRPLVYALVRRIQEDDTERLAEWDEQWRTRASFRRVFYLMSGVWGAGLLAEAVVRVPLITMLPVDVVPAVSMALQLGTIGLLALWTFWYRRRRQQLAAAAR